MKHYFFTLLILWIFAGQAQIKILFDATKAETASNADWQIDADQFNLRYNPNPYIGGHEANPQRFPTPDQSTVTTNTQEDYWTGGNSAWGIELVQYGYQVETLPFDAHISFNDPNNPQDLSNYDVFIVTEPNILFTSDEKTAIINFVANGGGLFMTSDHDVSDRNGDGVDSVDVWNDLADNNTITTDPFGILFNNDNLSFTTYNVANLPDNPILHGFFGDVIALEFHNGTTLNLFSSDNSSVTGLIFKQGDPNTILFASATYGQGRVVAIGDSSPADDGTGDTGDHLYDGWFSEANGSHRKLMLNATIWLAEGSTNVIAETDFQPVKVFVKNGKLQILSSDMKITEIRIFNTAGQLVITQNRFSNNIDISSLKPGVYFLQLTDTQNHSFFTKFVY